MPVVDTSLTSKDSVLLRPTWDQLQSQVAELTARVEKEVAANETIREQFRHDFGLVSDRLLEEANDRDWCSDYNDLIINVNGRLQGPHRLQERNGSFEVCVDIRGTLTTSVTVNIEAADEAAARAAVDNMEIDEICSMARGVDADALLTRIASDDPFEDIVITDIVVF